MAGDKVEITVTINDDHETFLSEMAEVYDLPDADKALRVLLDYAMTDGDKAVIFDEIRCIRCS